MYYKIIVSKNNQIVSELGEFESEWTRMNKIGHKIMREMRGCVIEIFRRRSQEKEYHSIQSMVLKA